MPPVSDLAAALLSGAVVLTPVVVKILARVWPSRQVALSEQMVKMLSRQTEILERMDRHLELDAERHRQHFGAQERLSREVADAARDTRELLHLVRAEAGR